MQVTRHLASLQRAASKGSLSLSVPRTFPQACLSRAFSAENELTEEQQMELVRVKMDEELMASQKDVSPWTVSDLAHIRTSQPPANPAEIAALDGMLEKQAKRTVIIRQKPKSAMTSGLEATKSFTLSWKQGTRWSNPLMGWTSTDDPMSNLELRFESEEQAMFFCNKMGWSYEIEKERYISGRKGRVMGQNTYSHNFLPPSIEHDLSQNGKKTKVFDRDGKDASHFHKFLKYHGNGDVGQHGPNPDGVKN
mmetsp:Transcript_37904/g.49905  ORF Transcript_37904/g.49905 Transcript_37904/m.49905 type:complete len:251 (+) Transcript_37904:70-822(+)